MIVQKQPKTVRRSRPRSIILSDAVLQVRSGNSKNRRPKQRSSRRCAENGSVSALSIHRCALERIAVLCLQDSLIIHRLLWKLFHIEDNINVNTHRIKAKNKDIAGLRKEQVRPRAHISAFESPLTSSPPAVSHFRKSTISR